MQDVPVPKTSHSLRIDKKNMLNLLLNICLLKNKDPPKNLTQPMDPEIKVWTLLFPLNMWSQKFKA